MASLLRSLTHSLFNLPYRKSFNTPNQLILAGVGLKPAPMREMWFIFPLLMSPLEPLTPRIPEPLFRCGVCHVCSDLRIFGRVRSGFSGLFLCQKSKRERR